MKHVFKRKTCFPALIVLVLVAAMVLSLSACGGSSTSSGETTGPTTANVTEVGQGSKAFDFTVVDADGNTTEFWVSTDADTVGAALLDLGLIAGEDSSFGLYVKTVNGITADYDVDGHYWAFYVNGEYASAGVDSTVIEDGAVYSFRVE